MMPVCLVALALQGCSPAPSYVFFGAYFPRWLLAGVLGVAAALAAHLLFRLTGWADKLPWQLSVCSAIGMIAAVLFWLPGAR